MMIALSKSTMSNHKYMAGLFLLLLLSTADAFAIDKVFKANEDISYQHVTYNTHVINEEKRQSLQILPNQLSIDNKKNIDEFDSFYPLVEFFDKKPSKPYISDGVKFLSNKQSFIDLGVNLNQMALFIKQVGELYESVFYDEINDLSLPNKMMIIKVKISGNKKDCDKCNQVKVSFHSSDSFGPEIKTFSKSVREINPIEIQNINSNQIAEFQIYLNTKPKDFRVQEKILKKPLIHVSPFSDRG